MKPLYRRARSLSAAIALLVAFVAPMYAAPVLAQSVSSPAKIIVHMTFAGPFRHTTTLSQPVNSTVSPVNKCYVLEAKPAAATTFTVTVHKGPNLSSGDTFSLSIIGFRSAVSTYAGLKTPTPSHPIPSGAGLTISIGAGAASSHSYNTNTEGTKPATMTVHVSNGGKSGSFTASHIAHAAGETIAGHWSCPQVKINKPRS